MENKEKFKLFVKEHPELINHVKEDKMTWQKFYEIYNIYGEDNKVWDAYLKDSSTINDRTDNNVTAGVFESAVAPVKEVMSYLSKIEPTKLQNGINSLQKGLTLFQELFIKDKKNPNVVKPTERPIYKRFED